MGRLTRYNCVCVYGLELVAPRVTLTTLRISYVEVMEELYAEIY